MSVSVKEKETYTIIQETKPGGMEAIFYKGSEVLEIYEDRYKALTFQKVQIPFYKKRLVELKKAQRNEVLEFSQGSITIQFEKEKIPFLEECFKQMEGAAE